MSLLGLGHAQQNTFALLIGLPLGQIPVNTRRFDFSAPVLLQCLDRFGVLRHGNNHSARARAASTGIGLDFDCCTVMTSATEPMMSPAASKARAVSVSPANKAPRITATMGFT